jgi:hypothetical protein
MLWKNTGKGVMTVYGYFDRGELVAMGGAK